MTIFKRSLFFALVSTILLSSYSFGQQGNNSVSSIKWSSNVLRIDAEGPIQYSKSRLETPPRLIVDIKDCFLPEDYDAKKFTGRLGESITVYKTGKDNVRIIFIGDASINRKIFLKNNNKTLLAKIARISDETVDEQDNDEIAYQQPQVIKYTAGNLKGLTIEENEKGSEVRIFGSRKIKYSTYLLKNPSRFAIDLLNILPPDYPLPRYSPTMLVSGVRVGRAASGIDATRIVIDLSDDNFDWKVSSSITGEKLKIKFAPSEKKVAAKGPGFKVIIDPGHGGYDHGAQYGGFNEKDITLSISKKLKEELEKSGIEVFLTRENDNFVSLAERVEITNSVRPKLFISVHANALRSHSVRGAETYYWTPQSQKLAYLIHKNVLKSVKVPDHHIRKARFYVIKYTPIPAVLAELGFLSNAFDRKLLTNPTVQTKYAQALAGAVYKYLGVTPQKEEKKELAKNTTEPTGAMSAAATAMTTANTAMATTNTAMAPQKTESSMATGQ